MGKTPPSCCCTCQLVSFREEFLKQKSVNPKMHYRLCKKKIMILPCTINSRLILHIKGHFTLPFDHGVL